MVSKNQLAHCILCNIAYCVCVTIVALAHIINDSIKLKFEVWLQIFLSITKKWMAVMNTHWCISDGNMWHDKSRH